ncbi:MAG: hypothetical protein QMD17_01760 [Rhodocyclaceae bacterium]|nr:hypothetical protein [Rhodocyclaceae bacterium]
MNSAPGQAVLASLVGRALLIAAGRLFVSSATVVAIGTSLPELVTVLLARYRGHDDIGGGTLLGSNLYNGMAIVGVAASIHPLQAQLAEVAITLGMGTLSLLLLIPGRDGVIHPMRGYLPLGCYVVFVVATATTGRVL